VSSYRYAERAARLLRAARARIRPHQSVAADSAISVLAQTIVRGASRRRRRRAAALIGTATAFLGVALALAWSPWRSRPPVLPAAGAMVAARPRLVVAAGGLARLTTPDGQVHPLPPGHEWLAGERLRSDALPFVLSAADGTTITLQPHSDLSLLRADTQRWLRLASGDVSVQVAKLRADERFVIVTPDAEVEVRGTRFHVAIAPPDGACGGTATRVVVDEGLVVVRSSGRTTRLPAGTRWPSECAVEPPAAAPPPPPSGYSAGGSKRLVKGPPTLASPRDGVSAPSASTLATENDLFGAALKAERAGDLRAAAQLLEVLVSRFPGSPLKESAERARARVNASKASTSASP
jgi:FecR protein